jgi:hypothetical protein
MIERTPPKLATALLRWFGPAGPALTGDLIERYHSGQSRWWYWRQVICAIPLVQWPMVRRKMEAAMERTAAYLIGALALGGLTATLQGFGIGSSHWMAAAVGGPITGLAVGVAVHWFAATNLLRWTFWMSAAALVITAMGAKCAMCWFVGA